MDGARTESDKAPVVVGTPLYGPCDVGRSTSGLTTGGEGPVELDEKLKWDNRLLVVLR